MRGTEGDKTGGGLNQPPVSSFKHEMAETASAYWRVAGGDGTVLQPGVDLGQLVLDLLRNLVLEVMEGGQTGSAKVVAALERACRRLVDQRLDPPG